MNVFLSASVPLPTRDPIFFETADVVAIRDAIKSLALHVAKEGTITFGGHPAITPLMSLVIKNLMPNRARSFILYQSEYFLRQFPRENDDFIDVRIIPAADAGRDASLYAMRCEMLTHCRYDAAFFVGGMEGVIDEHNLLQKLQPDVALFPIASTGGAALELYKKSAGLREDLLTQLTYPTLYRDILAEI